MFAKAKICQYYVTITVDQNVIGLEVPMDEVNFVHRLDSQNCTSDVKATRLFAQNIFSHKQCHEITTWLKVHYKIKVLIILKTVFQIDNPLILGLDEHLTLSLDVINLILVDHLGLLHSLDSDDISRFDMSANSDLTECTSSYNGEWIEIARR